jgi:hypothetical protein
MTDNDDHDHDHDHDGNECCGEVAISIMPRDEDLAARGISQEDFDAAIVEAIDAWENDDSDDQLPLEDRLLTIGGQSLRLGDLADIEISGDFEDLGEDE